MTAYPYTFHRKSKVGGGTVPGNSDTLQADSIEAATAAVEAMAWPDNATLATITVTGRADVVITR